MCPQISWITWILRFFKLLKFAPLFAAPSVLRTGSFVPSPSEPFSRLNASKLGKCWHFPSFEAFRRENGPDGKGTKDPVRSPANNGKVQRREIRATDSTGAGQRQGREVWVKQFDAVCLKRWTKNIKINVRFSGSDTVKLHPQICQFLFT